MNNEIKLLHFYQGEPEIWLFGGSVAGSYLASRIRIFFLESRIRIRNPTLQQSQQSEAIMFHVKILDSDLVFCRSHGTDVRNQ